MVLSCMVAAALIVNGFEIVVSRRALAAAKANQFGTFLLCLWWCWGEQWRLEVQWTLIGTILQSRRSQMTLASIILRFLCTVLIWYHIRRIGLQGLVRERRQMRCGCCWLRLSFLNMPLIERAHGRHLRMVATISITKHLVGYEEVAVLAGSRHQAGSCHHRGGGLPILCSAEHRLQLDSVLVLLYRDFGLPGATAATYHCVKYFMFFNKLIS